MPPVPWRLRGLALLAAPAWLLENAVANEEGRQVQHAAAFLLVAFLLVAIYVAFWLAVPRAWSAALAVLTIPVAIAASLGIEHSLPAIALWLYTLLWLYPAIALCFAAPETMSAAALIVVCVLAVVVLFPMLGWGVTTDVPSWVWLWRELGHTILAVGLPILAAGLVASTTRRLLSATERLGRAQRQLAVAAVQEERTRFARDLHDLLGHSLTVLVAKVRLARRLPPPEADGELADAERLALGALDEVRQAVEGYRAPTLDSQIAGARAALAAAEIAFEVSGSANPVAAGAEGALAISVREAVTNVVRHSDAAHCWLTIGRDGGSAWVEVRDDGRAAKNGPASGLAGLRDRLAGLGGTVTWGPRAGGGFRVRATVPAEGQMEEPAPA
jgi:signal transduction histidine kinase